jgi:hypothetical protein
MLKFLSFENQKSEQRSSQEIRVCDIYFFI